MSNVQHQLLSGALSGFATTISLQPFDLLKTRMQQGDGAPSIARLQPALVPSPSRILTAVRGVIAAEGTIGLWRGTAASLVRNIPGVAMYMTCLTQMRTLMATSPHFSSHVRRSTQPTPTGSVLPSLTSQGNLLAGATTRVAVGFLLNPFSVLKARFESNIYAYESLSSEFVAITRQGPSQLLRGFVASSMRDAPYAGLFVVFYEGIKREAAYLVPPTSQSHSTVMHGLSAALAGAIATMVTHPFDVIKTKIQVRPEARYDGFVRATLTIWKQRGVAGFFDGATLRMSRKVLSSAIGWAVYEGVLMFMRTA